MPPRKRATPAQQPDTPSEATDQPQAQQEEQGIDPATLQAPTYQPGEQLPNVHQAMAKAMATVRAVGKWGQNTEQGYSFRSIDHFMTALNPAMAAAGVHVVPRVLQRITDDSHTTRAGSVMRWVDVEMAFTFYGPDGTCVEAVTWGEARDSADKATNKAMTGAFKYAIMQAFMVPTQDLQDGDRDSPEAQPAGQQGQQQGQQQPSPEEERAKRERLAATIAAADADPATVEGLRRDVLLVCDGFKGTVRAGKLRALWQDAASTRALGHTVRVPEAWRQASDPEECTLHQLIQGAVGRGDDLPPSGEAQPDQPAEQPAAAEPPASPNGVQRGTPDEDPWANDPGMSDRPSDPGTPTRSA